jgi:hypothetical protein
MLSHMHWIEITSPCPVLNTPDFKAVFSGASLPLNEKGHPHHFEFVALPGMRFFVEGAASTHILQIQWPEYGAIKLYIDKRLTKQVFGKGSEKKTPLSAQTLLQKMERRIGVSYVWGGNWADGVREMVALYPPSSKRAKLLPRAIPPIYKVTESR